MQIPLISMKRLVALLALFLAAAALSSSAAAQEGLGEFGPHSFQLEVFAYVDSSDWNEFLGIREELFLQIADAVEAAGTRLAVPAQTAYLARDSVGEPVYRRIARPM